MQPEPLRRQQVDDIHVRAFDQGRESLDGRTAELLGLELGPAVNLVIDGGDQEPVRQSCQRRLVPALPEAAQTDHSDPEPNLFRLAQDRLLALPHRDPRRQADRMASAKLPRGYHLTRKSATQKKIRADAPEAR